MNDKNNIEQIYGLAPLQEGILFHSLADGHAGVYFDQYTLNITGTLDVELLKKSFHQLFRQHEILRAAFVYEGVAKPLQVIVRNRVGEFTYRDLTLKKDPDQIIQTLIAEDKIEYFNLQKDPLMRLKVFRSKSDSYVVLLSWHHLIIDGWSLGILIDDLVSNYKQLLGNPDHEPSVAKGFGSFLQYLKTRDTERDGAFWTNYLNTFSEPTRLLDTVEHYQQGERKKITIDFNAEELGKIKSFCSKHNFTLNTIVQAAWSIVLSSHSGRSDVMFGQVVSGRPFDLSDSDAVVGLFINTIPIRVNTAAANEWIPFLSELQHRFIQSIEYQNHPLHEIQKCTPLKRDLFDHILLFENYPIPDQQQLPFVVNDFRKEDNSNFNLVIEVRDQPFLVIDFKYNTTQFSEKLVETFAGRLKETVLSAARDVLTKKTQSLPASDLEKLTRINHTDREWTTGTILDLWNTSVKEAPHSIAVVCDDRSYTHAFIDQWSRQLASLLSVKHRVRKNDIVAINPVADIATVVSVIAIMRCGAAYLPIDSKAPIVRLEKMLSDANVKIILSDDDSITQHLPLVRVIGIEEGLERNKTLIEFDQVSGNDTAYCIFTSGTTGQPKGILINHNSLANYVNWLIHRFNPEKKDRTVILSSLSYDLPMTAFWGSLASGAELHFLHEDTVFNPDEVLQYLVKTSITFIKTTPSVFSLLVNHHNSPATVAALRLRLIFIGGELIRPADIGSYLRHHPKVKFINHYGPTETTIGILTNEIQENDFEDFSSSPTIGYPIDNSKVVIMQPNGTLAPVGVEGEVCLAGAGMFRGYLNAPELTGSKLVTFDAFPGITFYRSGDLGRLRSDGKCILLGRVDRQVKINGYRVDLLEIEAVVKQIAAVKDVVVVKQTDEAERDVLFCYYTSVDQQAVGDLRSHVIKHLPVAFCPAFFMCVEKIPLNANGKVDTNKLLMLALPVATPPVEQTKFANDTEKSIVEVWMRVLGYPHIDSNSSYFDLGGDSIKAIQIASQLRRLGFNVSVKDIYSSKTVRDLAGKMIKRTQDDPVEPQITLHTHVLPPVQWTEEFQSDLGLTVDQVEGMLPLHSLQVGMMHSYLRNPNSQAYQRKTIWKTNELKPAAFEQAINDTYASHQGLRVIFTRGLTQEPLQLVLRKHIASYQLIDIHHLKPGEAEDYVNEFSTHSNTGINLLNGQVPIRWVIFVGKKECYIVLEHHHILLDAWSSYLMLDEIIRRYQVLLADSKIKIPKTAQLASYHYWLTENNQEAARNFWSSYLEGINKATWVYGRSEIKLETSGPGNIVHEFAEGTLKKLTQIAGQLNGTAFMVIRAIWSVILGKQNNTNEIVFGQEVSGRSSDMRDVDQVIGMVINVLPNRVLIGPTMTFADLVSTMMEYDRQVDMVQYYHLSDIFKLTPLRDQLFTHVLSLEPEFTYSSVDNSFKPEVKFTKGSTGQDIEITFILRDNKLLLELEFDKAWYDETKLLRVPAHFSDTLNKVFDNVDILLESINSVPVKERGNWLTVAKPVHAIHLDEPEPDNLTTSEHTIFDIFTTILGQGRAQVHHSFFELGGNSLSAIQLIGRINKTFGTSMSIDVIYEHPSISSLAKLLDGSKTNQGNHRNEIDGVEEQDHYPLSVEQRRIWIDMMLQARGAYNVTDCYLIKGELNKQLLEHSLSETVKQHNVLRSLFCEVDGAGRQRYAEDHHIDVMERDVAGLTDHELQLALQEWSNQEIRLDHFPLVKVCLNRLSPNQVILQIAMPHLLTDAWSMSLFYKEVISRYLKIPVGSIESFSYANYAIDQLRSSFRVATTEYWREEFKDGVPRLNLARAMAHHEDAMHGDHEMITISGNQFKKLKLLGSWEQATNFITLMTLLKVHFHQFTREDRIVIGTSMSSRNDQRLEDQIGFFLNTIPVLSHIGKGSFRDHLKREKKKVLDGFSHSDYPFEEIARNFSFGEGLFDIMLEFENRKDETLSFEGSGLHISPYFVNRGVPKFTLTMFAEEYDDRIEILAEYSPQRLNKQQVQYHLDSICRLIDTAYAQPYDDIGNYSLTSLPDIERINSYGHGIVRECMHRSLPAAIKSSLHENANQVALELSGRSLTYRELDQLSNMLGNRIMSHPRYRQGLRVGLVFSRSFEWVISVLACFKAGCTFVPIDPDYPDGRIKHMLEDSDVSIVMTSLAYRSRLKNLSGIEAWIIDATESLPESVTDCNNYSEKNGAAYILYTSGSTGMPKGVCIEMDTLHNYIDWSVRAYYEGKAITFGMITSVSFDLTMTGLLATLISGGKMVLFDTGSPEELVSKLFSNRQITCTKLTPSHIRIARLLKLEFTFLNNIILGGEEVKTEDIDYLQSISVGVKIFNEYGPTETTVGVTVSDISHARDLHIGKPIANAIVMVLDNRFRLLVEGQRGDIYVGGNTMARGYINQPEMTYDKFIEVPGLGRMYKTGDIGSWDFAGKLHFFGREDSQLKVRGYRIEKAEIEYAIRSVADVLDVFVGINEKDTIVAFLKTERTLDNVEIVDQLRALLPFYMIPGLIYNVDSFPVTINGKVDTRKLFAENRLETTVHEVSPAGRVLTDMWKEIFGDIPISPTDNFFSLGGHSLDAIRLVQMIAERCQVKISLDFVFNHPTIAKLSKAIESSSVVETHDRGTYEEQDHYPLLSQQKRIWLYEQREGNYPLYNVNLAFQIQGPLDKDRLKIAYRQLIQHHQSLRARFIITAGMPRQVIDEWSVKFDLTFIKLHTPVDSAIREFGARKFDTENGPLARAIVFECASDVSVLVISVHHSVTDGQSTNLILGELARFYQELPAQAVDSYSNALLNESMYLKSKMFESDRNYWQSRKLHTGIKGTFTEKMGSLPSSFKKEAVTLNLDESLTSSIRVFCSKRNITTLSFFMSIWHIVLKTIGSRKVVTIGFPASTHPDDVDKRTTGFFVNTLIHQQKIVENQPLDEFMETTWHELRDVLKHKRYPLELLVKDLRITNNIHELFDSMVTYENQDWLDNTSFPGNIVFNEIYCQTEENSIPVVFQIYESPAVFKLILDYRLDIMDNLVAAEYANAIRECCEKVVRNEALNVNEILSKPDRHIVLTPKLDVKEAF